LSQLPITLMHGEFYAANVLVQRTSNGVRVCPVDWEMAAAAPGVFDIAALSAGWDGARRRELAHAYQEAGAGATTETELDALLRSIDLSSVQIALQWLGWSRTWSPPTEHRRDWLDHLSGVVERLAI
jgi:thiamine kinase-like enzyme